METTTNIKESFRDATDLAMDAAEELQASSIMLLDIRTYRTFADYFIILTTDSTRQMRAVSQSIQGTLKSQGTALYSREGDHNSGWAVLDYGYLVIHLFSPEDREYFDLAGAWPEGKIIKFIQ
jgi:ribosome-associated protein